MNSEIAAPRPARRLGPIIIFAVITAGIIGLLALLAIAVRQHGSGALSSGNAPDFTVKTFDGQTYSLASLKGKPVVLNFWASWCIPCRDEAPGLQQAWETYKDQGLIVLGVDYVDTDADAQKFIAEFKENYPNGPDLGTLASQAYRISGVPETYFIDRNGKLLQGIDDQGRVKGNFIGPVPADVLDARIKDLLAQQ